ncbi:MAG: NAD(P)/FAD-dependent oxidoreductase [Chitinophagales bacterium]
MRNNHIMISFWEQQSFLQYDYIVIGSGIVGLSTAAFLKEQKPDCRVLVLERGIFPTGASTKNAGFACIGSLTELLADLETMPPEKVVELVVQRWKGLQLLRNRLGDETIDYQALGSYELLQAADMSCLDDLEMVNTLLKPALGGNAFDLLPSKNVKDFGFATKNIQAVICNTFEGQLNTGKMMASLLQYVQRLGVVVINGVEVVDFEEKNGGIKVYIESAMHSSKMAFSAAKVAVCTNAFTSKLLPEVDLKPGRGQVLITRPIENLPFRGIFHFDKGYYYFRNVGNRVLFGGGRNLAFEEETSTEFSENSTIVTHLKEKLQSMILPNTLFEVEMNWTGIMAFGKDKSPILSYWQRNNKVVIGVRLGGMGVAIGSDMGRQIAEMLL